MPSRNVLKIDVPDSYYHVYARGASRQEIFLDDIDFRYFLSLFQRYLADEEYTNKIGVPYVKLYDDIELLSYCLMPNHFHLLIYQINEHSMQRLMRGVMTAYSKYFNNKYKRSGSLFESRYKASRISSEVYLMHISRYIHLNPREWRNYQYTSLAYYTNGQSIDWLRPEKILDMFTSPAEYLDFIADYEDAKNELDIIKHELANK